MSVKIKGVAMTASTNDYDEVLRVMQLYIDGFNDNDISKFREAFDEDAWIVVIDSEGNLDKRLISERFETWLRHQVGASWVGSFR
jgi:hypothetical protein